MALKTKSAIQLRRERCLRALDRIARTPITLGADYREVARVLLEMIDEAQISAAVEKASAAIDGSDR